MAIYLGNLNTKQILERLGVTLSEEDYRKMESMREDNADVPKGKWHGFDLPFQITCGDKEVASKIVEILSPLVSSFKTQIQIAHK